MRKSTAIAWLTVGFILGLFATADWWLPGPSDLDTAQAVAMDLQDARQAAQEAPQ